MPQGHPMACEPIRLNHAALRAHARAREALPSTFNPKVAGSIPARPIVAAKTDATPRRAAAARRNSVTANPRRCQAARSGTTDTAATARRAGERPAAGPGTGRAGRRTRRREERLVVRDRRGTLGWIEVVLASGGRGVSSAWVARGHRRRWLCDPDWERQRTCVVGFASSRRESADVSGPIDRGALGRASSAEWAEDGSGVRVPPSAEVASRPSGNDCRRVPAAT
jgi:hypothetical protein